MTNESIERFISRWQAAGGSERANYQLFVGELTELLGLPRPDPARDDTRDNAYVFERRVRFRHGDGAESHGFIDCYRRGAFVLEAKKLRRSGLSPTAFDDALQRARGQAESYARALPAEEGRPPFLVVVDVGNVIELYAEFSRSGATYTPFPDPRSHRIRLTDFRDEAVRARLKALWLDPLSLDPTRATARVTREVAERLAEVAKALEGAGHAPEVVAGFLSRCLFTMFAEDVELLPKRAFSGLIESLRDNPAQFVPLVGELWQAMDKGAFSVAIRAALPRFNGKLFKEPLVLPLTRDQIELLIKAARADWTQVEPAIFGTLLERALDPTERHALGAHYTPRAYVERLVLPTVIEPLRASWSHVQAAALMLANEGKVKEAIAEVRAFHHRLCELKVLDPACGSGNFLYVTLEHMKRLEGEVLNQLDEIGHTQAMLETEGLSVDPHQFLGLEINPRAAAVAEMVLWIGYLQWHFRTRGHVMPPQPVLKDFRNIECRDAVLAYDRMEYVTDARGVPVSRWDGKTTKPHPVTGEQVPDEAAQVPLERYVNPRRAEWPQADVVVGNPPFIGNKRMRAALGDGYVEALRGAWSEMPESADFVMYWWHKAASLVCAGALSRFGFITTNSVTQAFNRRVLERHLAAGDGAAPPSLAAESAECVGRGSPVPLHLAFAVPDHPWVDSADGAAVRIAMTVGAMGAGEGRLLSVTDEREGGGDGLEVQAVERAGVIHADLTIGANVSSAKPMQANGGLSFRGMIPHGEGFLIAPKEGAALDGGSLLRPYRNGKDLTDRPRGVMVIDTFGLSEAGLRSRYPASWQWLYDRVKPERDHNPRKNRRENWWLFGENQPRMRASVEGLSRYIATGQTAKHRIFQFLDASILPDDKLIAIALDDAYFLGVLSSHIHVAWALAAGGWLGVGNDPVYNKSKCFDAFPFPAATPEHQARIRDLAEQIDAHRKRQQAAHAGLTLTGMYNVLEKLKVSLPMTAKEKAIHEMGLVSVLKSLHDELDAAVMEAYGWRDAPSDETILERLVALNAERAAEEARGVVRWLRPAFQHPEAAAVVGRPSGRQETLDIPQGFPSVIGLKPDLQVPAKQPWPATLPEQVAAVARALAEARAPLAEADLAARFTGKGPWKKRLPQLLDTLVALGRARQSGDGWMGV
ncbi:MAG: class I SAM-dependent DNA methyltransferase [Rhodocyclales bacterium]|nr:class I SAM-dependent DNA methyltransferase [Rhodocyclales bacterium]